MALGNSTTSAKNADLSKIKEVLVLKETFWN